MVAGPPRAADLPPALKDLQARLAEAMSGDAGRLHRQLAQLADLVRRGKPHDRLQAGIEAALAGSIARVARRRALVPQAIRLPRGTAGLRRARAHRRGDRGAPGRDPRRRHRLGQDHPAAEALPRARARRARHDRPHPAAAHRRAGGRGTHRRGTAGAAGPAIVAYQVRFADRSSPDTLVKLMTDGILLAEIQHDRRLERYDTHHHRRGARAQPQHRLPARLPEAAAARAPRSQARDHLGDHRRRALRAPLRRRAGDPGRGAHLPGRGLVPASRPRRSPTSTRAIVAAIEELIAHERGTPHAGRGDILVFLAGERDIRETALALRKSDIAHAEVLPLYSRLSQAEQARVLRPGARAGRRIVLATNVAETSLTVPGIRYVIDPGLARISRYSVAARRCSACRSSRSRAPAPSSARAAAGASSEGICVRLYSEEDFAARPAFTEPEILRTGLASVILQMHALGLGEIGTFPVPRPARGAPDQRRHPPARGARRARGQAPDRDRPAAGAAAGGSAHRAHAAGGGRARCAGRDAGGRELPQRAGSARAPRREAAGRRREPSPLCLRHL